VLAVFAIVWATDTAAMACGRLIGGPKLAPRISPRKTWAGAVGGLVGGTAAGAIAGLAGDLSNVAVFAAVAAGLSVIGQIGDHAESAVKRRFNVKDSGQLIPGHGGFLDRLDAFLAVCIAAGAIGLIRGGTADPAGGLLLW
jgi:phosphatidate cytidylyltransferase